MLEATKIWDMVLRAAQRCFSHPLDAASSGMEHLSQVHSCRVAQVFSRCSSETPALTHFSPLKLK